MIQYFCLENNKIQPTDLANATIFLAITPTADEKKFLTAHESLDEHSVNSSLDPDELSRLEYETDHIVLIVKKPQNYSTENKFQFQVSSMGLFLFENKVIIVTDTEPPFVSDRRFNKVSSLKSLVLKLLSYCIYHFMEHLKIISQISDELEQKINSSMENRYLIFMFSLSKGLVYYLNAINSNGVLLQKLSNNQKVNLKESEKELLEDLSIDNLQCYQIAEIYSNIISSMMDARASIVSNNLNVLMKTLNIITIAIMVPTFVVSAFSMNVHIPLSELPYAFWIIMGLAGVSVLLFFSYWRNKKW